MKTQINGIEITPEMAELLEEWFEEDRESSPSIFVKYLNSIQDLLCRVLIDHNLVKEADVKDCISSIICIKDNFNRLIPVDDIESGKVFGPHRHSSQDFRCA